MSAVLRLAELLVCVLFVGWTVVFPLATLLSLMLTLPLLAILFRQPARKRVHRVAPVLQA